MSPIRKLKRIVWITPPEIAPEKAIEGYMRLIYLFAVLNALATSALLWTIAIMVLKYSR